MFPVPYSFKVIIETHLKLIGMHRDLHFFFQMELVISFGSMKDSRHLPLSIVQSDRKMHLVLRFMKGDENKGFFV